MAWKAYAQFWDLSPRGNCSVFYFLSPQSKGSLSKRLPEEIELVHQQQQMGEGITLAEPPLAYVSNLSQVPEETAHIFALRLHRLRELPSTWSAAQAADFELRWMTLHECFAKFSSFLIAGQSHLVPRPSRSEMHSQKSTWELAHREGYYLAQKLFERYCSGEIKLESLRDWFKMDWTQSRGSRAMRRLYVLAQEAPLTKNLR